MLKVSEYNHTPRGILSRAKSAPQDDKKWDNTFLVILSAVKDLNSRCSEKRQLLANKAIPASHSNRKFASPSADLIEN
ncbi:hypothetical protein [Antarcticibacterium flavum]|nr:hypothetical protein [Antarcticibacterium flavum]